MGRCRDLNRKNLFFPAERADRFGFAVSLGLWCCALAFSSQAQEVSTIFAGYSHGLAISSNRLWGWGSNQPVGTIGNIASLKTGKETNLFLTYRVGGETNWRWITGMGDTRGTTYAIRTDGSLWAWGDNSLGQLGDGTGLDSKVPVRVGTENNWKTVSAAGGKVFGLKTDGTLWAWGENRLNSGALGIGRGRDAKQYLPVPLGQGHQWEGVASFPGGRFWSPFLEGVPWVNVKSGGAAISSRGEVWSWGNALSISTNFSPTRFGAETNWKQIAFGFCPFALKQDGTLWQFVYTRRNLTTIGPSQWERAEIFKKLPDENGTNWASLSGSFYDFPPANETVFSFAFTNYSEGDYEYGNWLEGHFLGVKKDGTLWAWGNNHRGQLGTGSTNHVLFPQQVGADTDWTEASAGPFYSLAKKADGSIWVWGVIGGQADPYVKVPTRVGADNDWLMAVAGSDYSLAVKTDGRVFACGNTDLASGGVTNAGSVSMQTEFFAIQSAGTNRTDLTWNEAGWTNGLAAYRRKMVAIETSGNLRIWGDAFGDYPGDSRTNLPVPIPEDLDTTRPWWDPERYEPGVLSLPGPWVSITGNSGTTKEGSRADGNTLPAGFAAAVRADGTLWAWGANTNGQLGDGTRIPKDLPIRIGSGTNWSKVEAGGGHILAMQKDGSVWAWGENDRGQLAAKATNLISLQYNSNLISVVTNKTYDIRFAPVRVTTTTTTNWELTPFTLSTLNFDTNVVEPRNILPASWGGREISAGGKNSLILKKDGTLWELGKGPTSPVTLSITTFPQVVKVITNIKVAPVQILRFTNFQSAVLDQTSNNQIQNVTTNGWRWKSGPFSFSAGDRHNLAVRGDGFLHSWGENDTAQLGNGSLTGTNQPTLVGAGNRWKKVFAGFKHSLAIKDDGSLWAWGLNDGRLGLPFATAQTFYDPAKIEFGPAGLATLTLDNGRTGTEKISGQGLAAFLPRTARAVFSAQLVEGILGPTHRPWEGEGQYLFAGRRLIFSNAYLSFLTTNADSIATDSAESTNSKAIPQGAFVRLEWATLDRSATNPAFYQGEAKFVWIDPSSFSSPLTVADRYDRLKPRNGKTCRLTLLFDEDQDGDGIPNIADTVHQGTAPVLTSTSRLTLGVGESRNLPYVVTVKTNTNSGTNSILANEDLSALPPGLFYTTNGFDGVPTDEAVGLWEVVVGAKNDAGEAYQTVFLNVLPPPPAITSADSILWRQGSSVFEYQITAANDAYPGHPLKYSAAILPAGLSVHPTNGWIRPARAGQTNLPVPGLYRWSLVASNAAGADTNTLLVRVEPPGTGEWTAGVPLTYLVNLGPGTTYTVSGLPAGLTFNPSSGLITGTPVVAGTNEVTVISRSRSGTHTNRILLPIRLGRPEIVGANRLNFTGANPLKRNEFFRYQISARSAGQPWAGASDFTSALAPLWTNASGFRANLSAFSGTLRYGWTTTNAAFASLDWNQPLPLDSGWQVSVEAAFSTNRLDGFLQNQQSLAAMLLALRDRSANSAASNFVSIYLEGSTNFPSGEVVAEGVVDGVTNGSVSEAAVGGRSALSFRYLPVDGSMVTRADAGTTNLAWSEFQTSSLATWTNAARSNSLVLRLMGQSAASTNRAAPYPFFRRFVVSPLGDLTYSSSNLPAGLSLDPLTGLISGTPSVATNSQSSTVLISNGLGTTQLNILFRVQ